jgi:hypothetical protein
MKGIGAVVGSSFGSSCGSRIEEFSRCQRKDGQCAQWSRCGRSRDAERRANEGMRLFHLHLLVVLNTHNAGEKDTSLML